MSKTSKNPAPKSKKPTVKKDVATKVSAPKDAASKTTAPAPAPKSRDRRLPAPGTSTVREYKGKSLKVRYLDDGVEVDGTRFDSLSAAARHVTGAESINGFLFFNLLATKAKEPKALAAKPSKGAKPAAAPVPGNEIGTPAGQRAALEAAGLVKKASRKPAGTESK